MDRGEVVGGIIGALLLCIFVGIVGWIGYKDTQEKRIKDETMLNLIIENEKLKILQEQNQ